MRKITLGWLTAHACEDAAKKFKEVFGDSVDVDIQAGRKAAEAGFDIDWAAANMLSIQARLVWRAAVSGAQQERDANIKSRVDLIRDRFKQDPPISDNRAADTLRSTAQALTELDTQYASRVAVAFAICFNGDPDPIDCENVEDQDQEEEEEEESDADDSDD